MFLLGALSLISLVSVVTFWKLLPYLTTEEIVMDRLTKLVRVIELGEQPRTLDELAVAIEDAIRTNKSFKEVEQQRDQFKKETESLTASFAESRKTQESLEAQIADMKQKLARAEEEMKAKEPEVRKRMERLKAVTGKTVEAVQGLARFLQGSSGTETDWRQRAEHAHLTLGSLLQAARLAEEDERKVFLAAADDCVRIATLQRSRELRDRYLDQTITELLGPKFSKSFNLVRERFEKELAAALLPEVLGPPAGISMMKLQFAEGDATKDAPRLRENWTVFRTGLLSSATEAELAYARQYTLRALQSVSSSEKDLEIVEKWVTDGLKSVQDLSGSYINPIPGLLGDDKVDQAFTLFMRSLRQQVEDQQPYMTWALVKFGQRLLAEGAIQPPALSDEKTWQRKFELEKPFIFNHSLNRFELYDYQKLVCGIHADVLLYPAQALASSCTSSRDPSKKKTFRRTTLELEPGVYFFSLQEETEDDILLTVKGRYALETAAFFVENSPFGCFMEIPHAEAEGYWVTPVRGAVYRYDLAQNKREEKALPLAPEDTTAWTKHDLRSGASAAWRTLQVQAAQKFVQSLKRE
jgi:hypothetical protein